MTNVFQTILLTALPASGKSEIRNFMANIEPERLQNEFHIGQNLQLDDFPYVNFMRLIDGQCDVHHIDRIFYPTDEDPFFDERDWATLSILLDEDWHDLINLKKTTSHSAAKDLFARIDRAAVTAGIGERLSKLDPEIYDEIAAALEEEALNMRIEKESQYPDTLENKTIIIECSRGGRDGNPMPLKGTEGYQYYFPWLSYDLLKGAAILYIQVDPAESRRKNEARFDPNDPGSSLHHGTPLKVMLNDYGCDDMTYLKEQSDKPDTVAVKKGNDTIYLPIGIIDNRVDKTTFLREDKSTWPQDKTEVITKVIHDATDAMWKGYRK